MTISFRAATTADAPAISQLILGLTSYIEARPVDPGCESFLDTLTPEAIADRLAAPGFIYIVAEDESGICGVAALRDTRHVYHLFVKQDLHRQGLARALLERVMSTSDRSFFTVNSSLFAVPVYLRFGFVRAGEQQTRNGVTVQPMVYIKADQARETENSA
jgi:GNAT superfamily N-acetyltransferase